MKFHGRVLKYNQLKYLPSRNDLLDNDKKREVDIKIKNNENLLFMPTDIKEVQMQDVKYQKSKYKISIYGVLTDGRKIIVILDGITPYFDIWLKTEDIKKEAAHIWNELLETKDCFPDTDIQYKIINKKPFMGFRENEEPMMRIFFKKQKNRKNAIILVRDMGYKRNKDGDSLTFHDDLSCYYRVVCRDYGISFSQWCEISNYSIESHKNFKKLIYRVNIKNYNKFTGDVINNPLLSKDNTMVATWDIETHGMSGDVPQPENSDENMFMIGMTFHWQHSKESLLQVCLVDKPSASHPGFLTIICGTEERLIKAMGKVLEKMLPEYLIGFNDSDYDWKWVIERGRKYKGCISKLAEYMSCEIPWIPLKDDYVYAKLYKAEKVKLEATNDVIGRTLRIAGCITLDVRTIFRKLYPTAEKSSLKWFLAKNKLGGKKDMPYQELFRIYRTSRKLNNLDEPPEDELELNKKNMSLAADYCVTDAKRCHELLKIRNVIMDKREVADYSFTSMNDAFYRADGSKVRNLIIAIGQKRGFAFSNISKSRTTDAKYPGAFVFTPKKGMVTSKLTPEEHIIKSKSLKEKDEKYSNEWLTISDLEIKKIKNCVKKIGACPSKEEIEEWEIKNDYKFANCSKEFLLEKTGRPITGLDFSSLYPSIIMAYNLSPEMGIRNKEEARRIFKKGEHNLYKVSFPFDGRKVRAWFIRHDNKLDPSKDDYKFGLYPSILKQLFDLRKQYKKSMKVWNDKLEILNSLPRELLQEKSDEYENVQFQYNYWNTKQKALKVFMNTFYGEAGNQISPMFMLSIAGGITTAGKYNIKMVYDKVTKEGWQTRYGDTDSLYIGVPEKYFNEVDKLYYSGEKDKDWYWDQLVLITFKQIKQINEEVNNLLEQDNGTKFLKMAYEEALFPVAFLAKKKYYGIEHESIPNFNFKHLFIRGLEIKKRGTSDFLRKVFEKGIMEESVRKTNYKSLLELVIDQIDYIYSGMETCFEDFIQTDIYKPNKQNIKVQTFAKRMKAIGIEVKPFERFEYVIVKKYPYKFDHRGRKTELLIGDKMEFADRAKKENMEIDKDYYMEGSINGQLARAIVYHNDFYVEPEDDSEDALKKSELKIYEAAKKWVNSYCKKYYKSYAEKGKAYQKIFRHANKVVCDAFEEKMDKDLLNVIKSSHDENIYEWLSDKAKKIADKHTKNYGKKFIEDKLKKIASEIKNDFIAKTDLYDSDSDFESDDEKFIEQMNKKFAEKTEGKPPRKKIKIKDLTKEGKKILKDLIRKAKDEKIIELSKIYFADRDSLLSIHEKDFKRQNYVIERDIFNNLEKIKLVLSKHINLVVDISNKIKKIINIDNIYNKEGDKLEAKTIIQIEELKKDLFLDNAKEETEALFNNEQFKESVDSFNKLYNELIKNYISMNKTNLIVDYLKTIRDSKIRIYSLRN